MHTLKTPARRPKPTLKRDSTRGLNQLPGIQYDSWDARNTATLPISSGCPARPSGVPFTALSYISPFMKPAACTPSVSTSPGFSAFTRICFGPSSFDREIDRLFTAAFVAEKIDPYAAGIDPANDPILITDPPSRSPAVQTRPRPRYSPAHPASHASSRSQRT